MKKGKLTLHDTEGTPIHLTEAEVFVTVEDRNGKVTDIRAFPVKPEEGIFEFTIPDDMKSPIRVFSGVSVVLPLAKIKRSIDDYQSSKG